MFSLSVCADGGVPIHHKVYPGNRTDDTTHIETWKTLCQIVGVRDFLYVADEPSCAPMSNSTTSYSTVAER